MDILVRHLDRCCCSLCSNALFASLMFRSLEPNSIQSNCVTTKYTMWITSAHTHTHTHTNPNALSRPNAQHTQFNLILTLVLHPAKAIHLNTCSKLFLFGFENKGNREDREQASKQAKRDYSFIRLQQWFSNRIFEHIQIVCKSARDTEGALLAKNIVLLFSC